MQFFLSYGTLKSKNFQFSMLSQDWGAWLDWGFLHDPGVPHDTGVWHDQGAWFDMGVSTRTSPWLKHF